MSNRKRSQESQGFSDTDHEDASSDRSFLSLQTVCVHDIQQPLELISEDRENGPVFPILPSLIDQTIVSHSVILVEIPNEQSDHLPLIWSRTKKSWSYSRHKLSKRSILLAVTNPMRLRNMESLSELNVITLCVMTTSKWSSVL
jgi:hypothetical protein